MAKLNVPRKPIHTHEGGKAKHINSEMALRRSVMSCLLWEDQFYENGVAIADRIAALVPEVQPSTVASLAVEARNEMRLRHAPLLIAREMARYATHRRYVKDVLAEIIQRPDELAEFLAIYWKDGKAPIAAQVKKGLAEAFPKFDAYQLAKYNRDGVIKLRDVLFLCHAAPKDADQGAVWKKLVDGTLEPPDTWEVGLSSGANKRETWERLLRENKLGAMALLRNLRNFQKEGVDENLVTSGLKSIRPAKVLPFRFIAAARYAPQWEPEIEGAMLKCLSIQEKLPGHTALLLDVSGSMEDRVSSRSEISRLDAACGVAMLAREICEKVSVFTFSMKFVHVPARRGFALRDAIEGSQDHSGTPLGLAVKCIYADSGFRADRMDMGWRRHGIDYRGQGLRPDRLIVITDEQSHDNVPDPTGRGYMVNVASYQNGVGYGAWTHIDGWSEAAVRYIQEIEKSNIGFSDLS